MHKVLERNRALVIDWSAQQEIKPVDRIPTHKIDRSKTLEEAARLKDISDRARAARPVNGGSDILRVPSRGATDIL